MIDIEKVKERALKTIEDMSEGFRRRVSEIRNDVEEVVKMQSRLLKEPVAQLFGKIDLTQPSYQEDFTFEAQSVDLDFRYCHRQRVEVIDGGRIKPGKYAVIVSFIPLDDQGTP